MFRRFWNGEMHLNTGVAKHFLEWNCFIPRGGVGNYLVQLPHCTHGELWNYDHLVVILLVHPDGAMWPLVCMEMTYFVASLYSTPLQVSKQLLFSPIPKFISFSFFFWVGNRDSFTSTEVMTDGHESTGVRTWGYLTLEIMGFFVCLFILFKQFLNFFFKFTYRKMHSFWCIVLWVN